jgi:hypothetical protein
MKRFFTCLGVVFAVIVVVLIIVFAIFIPRAFQLRNEACTYLESEVPKIVENWNSQELINSATPELSSAMSNGGDIDKLFTMFRQLGSLKHLDQAGGGVYIWATTEHGSSTVGNFTIPAEFEKGPATIQIQVIKTGDTWKINGFRINSKVFLPPKADAANPVNP